MKQFSPPDKSARWRATVVADPNVKPSFLSLLNNPWVHRRELLRKGSNHGIDTVDHQVEVGYVDLPSRL